MKITIDREAKTVELQDSIVDLNKFIDEVYDILQDNIDGYKLVITKTYQLQYPYYPQPYIYTDNNLVINPSIYPFNTINCADGTTDITVNHTYMYNSTGQNNG